MNPNPERIAFFQSFCPIPVDELDRFHQKLRPGSCPKGTNLTEVGQIQTQLYLINSGVQMSYFEGRSKTHVMAFTYAPHLCAVPESFFFQSPSAYTLTCLSDTEYDAISFADLQVLFDQSQALERLFRRMTEAVLAGMIQRHIERHSLSMEERFSAFCQRSPHLLHRVPHKYIASYLGIDPTNFSKLFNSVKI